MNDKKQLKLSKKYALKIARELSYDKPIINAIENAKTTGEISIILYNAQKGDNI